MKFNGKEYRDWRKIYNAIKNGEDREYIEKLEDKGSCILCEKLHLDCDKCPLDYCDYKYSHWGVVVRWIDGRDDVTRKQALKSALIIAEIIEGTVCI